MYHAVMPVTQQVIYHESKPGPFTGVGDSLFPAWAPEHTNMAGVTAYMAALAARLRE
jgi:hypothetical protein